MVKTLIALMTSLCAALILSGVGAGAAQAGTKALSDKDAKAYAAAFDASRRGDFAAAEAAVQAADPLLAGWLELHKLMHPKAHVASYDELTRWLKAHGDQAGAERVYTLARKRKPAGAAEPAMPEALVASRNWQRAEAASGSAADTGRAARLAFYQGETQTARRLAAAAGERWIAGLAAYRLKDYADAWPRFEAVAQDPREDEWQRSAAAYWAARAAIASGQPHRAPALLRQAAAWPWTFYGQIAERQLGLEPAELTPVRGAPPPADAPAPRWPAFGGLTAPELVRLMKSDVRARRAVALVQVGLPTEAQAEVRVGMALAKGEPQRKPWRDLGLALGGAAPEPAKRRHRAGFDPADFPVPPLEPKGGFTQDRALVYAMVRQESRFNPLAVSGAGAVGLMQLMPEAAARAAGDDKLKSDMTPLLDPAVNLRVGQDYFRWLVERGVGDDLLHAVAAYNGGPGTLLNTLKRVGRDEDALMLIESLPSPETRDYVERVMAGYWIYRRKFGQDARSIDALAAGARKVSVNLDR